MNILVVCQYYYPEPFRITDICETLVQRGHSVTVLTGLPNYPEGTILSDYTKGKKRQEILNGVKVMRTFEIGRKKSKLFLMLNYFSYAISAWLQVLSLKDDFDAVFVYQLSPVMMAYPAIHYKRKFGKKLLLYCLDLWPDSLLSGGISENSLVYKLFLKISHNIYKNVDKIAVTSKGFLEYFETVLNIPSQEIIHLPQYAEELFEFGGPIIKKETTDFVFAGNIGDMQSVQTIIMAAKILEEEKNVRFHIVGSGSCLDKCKSLAQELSLNETVTFYGRLPVEKMPEFYNMADAMLLTLKGVKSISYTLPGKVQSYMAAGKPIIASANGEIKRVIEEAGCGYCTPAEDYVALAEAITQFLKSDEKQRMAQCSLTYYKEQYNKSKFMDMLEEMLSGLIV